MAIVKLLEDGSLELDGAIHYEGYTLEENIECAIEWMEEEQVEYVIVDEDDEIIWRK